MVPAVDRRRRGGRLRRGPWDHPVERLAGALAVLGRYGYDTMICHVDTPAQTDQFRPTLVTRPRADGVIVVSSRLSRARLGAFAAPGLPPATFDVADSGVPHAVTDDVAGGRLSTDHLLQTSVKGRR